MSRESSDAKTRRPPSPRWSFLLLLFLAACYRNENLGRYSGDFLVVNESTLDIRVTEVEGFGGASPECGNLPEGGNAGSRFGWLETFPKKCVMRWQVGEETEVRSQELKLDGVVPIGTNGETVFEFGEDQVWTVRFELEETQ